MTQGTQFVESMSILILLVLIGIFGGYWALHLVLTIFSKFEGLKKYKK